MHIPSQMLNGQICPVTAVVSAAAIGAAAYFAFRSKEKPDPLKFGAVASLIFAGQMMNFPVMNGTSGHLLGGLLASILLGTPFGVIAMALVVSVQALAFADGGVSVLGANLLNMAVIGAGLSGLVYDKMVREKLSGAAKVSATAIIAWSSIIMAALSCSIELGISGTIDFAKVLPSMLSVHSLIGIGELVITVAAVALFSANRVKSSKGWSVGLAGIGAALIGLVLSPFASSYPDGLEWVAQKYNFIHESAPNFVAPMADYSVKFISNEMLATGVAGLMGTMITFTVVYITGRMIAIKG